MFQILGIGEKNNTFLLHELDTNVDKQNKILELEPDIKKYFICGKWSCFKDPEMKRRYLSFIKYVTKDMEYNMLSAKANIKKDDNTYIHDVTYHIIKK